jgi:hypothetical protein
MSPASHLRGREFSSRLLSIGLVVENVALGQVFSEQFSFPLSVSFHWCSISINSFITDAMHSQLKVVICQEYNFDFDTSVHNAIFSTSSLISLRLWLR